MFDGDDQDFVVRRAARRRKLALDADTRRAFPTIQKWIDAQPWVRSLGRMLMDAERDTPINECRDVVVHTPIPEHLRAGEPYVVDYYGVICNMTIKHSVATIPTRTAWRNRFKSGNNRPPHLDLKPTLTILVILD